MFVVVCFVDLFVLGSIVKCFGMVVIISIILNSKNYSLEIK